MKTNKKRCFTRLCATTSNLNLTSPRISPSHGTTLHSFLCACCKRTPINAHHAAPYRELQELGHFDTKTSSRVFTPSDIRKLGDALFCDRRYDTVFVYHNGAESYYGARGFRGLLRV
ncbi:MAG: DUF4256 domain-containing protein [Ignavibacteria bacterium]|nr:DUF4256 domain-containing protein [Ignavibacteria bacterium]